MGTHSSKYKGDHCKLTFDTSCQLHDQAYSALDICSEEFQHQNGQWLTGRSYYSYYDFSEGTYYGTTHELQLLHGCGGYAHIVHANLKHQTNHQHSIGADGGDGSSLSTEGSGKINNITEGKNGI